MANLTGNNQGFTILELMIATIIFAGILLGATTALLQISRLYYGGVTQTQTQQVARNTINDISSQLQFSNDGITSNTATINGLTVHSLCMAGIRYSYVFDYAVTPGQAGPDAQHHLAHALWRDNAVDTNCNPADVTDPNLSAQDGQELLGNNMRLTDLTVSQVVSGQQLYSISLHIIYGDDDLMSPDANAPTGCKSIVGSQWCASSQLATQVYQRVQ